ncbi:MAG: LysR family transcriptional regulator [Candidatus Bathyarchaeia archaeon]|nr:LysR family transcriptional regulator [Candidatus Bathyarchaeota archaeon]
MAVTLYPRIKLWLVDEKDEAVFGDGLAMLLEAVDKYGSLFAASARLNMSYRYALHRVLLAEKRLGFKLIKRWRGGAGGGRSELTTEGRKILKEYGKIKSLIEEFIKVYKCEV